MIIFIAALSESCHLKLPYNSCMATILKNITATVTLTQKLEYSKISLSVFKEADEDLFCIEF